MPVIVRGVSEELSSAEEEVGGVSLFYTEMKGRTFISDLTCSGFYSNQLFLYAHTPNTFDICVICHPEPPRNTDSALLVWAGWHRWTFTHMQSGRDHPEDVWSILQGVVGLQRNPSQHVVRISFLQIRKIKQTTFSKRNFLSHTVQWMTTLSMGFIIHN